MIKLEVTNNTTGQLRKAEFDSSVYTVQLYPLGDNVTTNLVVLKTHKDEGDDPDATMIELYNDISNFGINNCSLKYYQNSTLVGTYSMLTGCNYNFDPNHLQDGVQVIEESLVFAMVK